VLPEFLFELRPYGFQAGRWVMAGRVVPRPKGVSALVLAGRVVLVLAVAVPQATLSLAGDGDTGIKLAIWIMLAMVLAGAGVLVLAAVWAKVIALLLAAGRLGAGMLGWMGQRVRTSASDLPANVPVG
jgi:hypothetical protein